MKRNALSIALAFIVLVCLLQHPAYSSGLPDCQLPFPVYYIPAGEPSGCTESLIINALEKFNAVAQDNGLTYDFFYYAGQRSETTVICDAPSGCEYQNGLDQVAWKTCYAGRTCKCVVNEGYEIDVIVDPADNVCTCSDPMPEDKVGALSTLMHELGHVLGLNEAGQPGGPSCQGTIMAPAMFGECGDTTLADCDIDMLLDMYPQYQDDPLEIYDVDVSTSFDPVSYTWQATFTFETNLPAKAKVKYDPQMDCYPACSYSHEQAGPDYYTASHTIVLDDLAPSTEYCYQIGAHANGETFPMWVGCRPTVEGTFGLDNSYDEIYDISHSFISLGCKIRVLWKTKFPSKNNKVYYRRQGYIIWSSVPAVQEDCDPDRQYVAFIPVKERKTYEFKISTKIDGTTYESGVMNRTTGLCEDPPIPGPVAQPDQDLTSLFIHSCPNPFNPQTTLSFNVPSPANVHLAVYSAAGEYVTTLVSRFCDKGIHSVDWDATNMRGVRVSSGIYLVRLKVGSEVLTSKIVLLK